MSEHEQLMQKIDTLLLNQKSIKERLDAIEKDRPMEVEKLIDRKEVEKLTGMSDHWCAKRLDDHIPKVKMGGAVRYRLKDVMEYIRSNTSKPI